MLAIQYRKVVDYIYTQSVPQKLGEFIMFIYNIRFHDVTSSSVKHPRPCSDSASAALRGVELDLRQFFVEARSVASCLVSAK